MYIYLQMQRLALYRISRLLLSNCFCPSYVILHSFKLAYLQMFHQKRLRSVLYKSLNQYLLFHKREIKTSHSKKKLILNWKFQIAIYYTYIMFLTTNGFSRLTDSKIFCKNHATIDLVFLFTTKDIRRNISLEFILRKML